MARKSLIILSCAAVPMALLVGLPRSSDTARGQEAGGAAIEDLIRDRRSLAALTRATELAETGPANTSLWKALLTLRPCSPADMQSGKEVAMKLVGVLARAYSTGQDPDIGVNLVRIAERLHGSLYAREYLESRDFAVVVAGARRSKRQSVELLQALASFYGNVRGEVDTSIELLDLAESILISSSGRDVRKDLLDVVRLRAEAKLKKDATGITALPDLHLVVMLDEAFGHHSNWALNRVGVAALAQGRTAEARTFLVLAGRARCDNVLRSFGYAKDLAMCLVRAGEVDAPIEYLTTARGEERPVRSDTLWALGLAYMGNGEREKAIACFMDYLKMDYRPEEGAVNAILSGLTQQK